MSVTANVEGVAEVAAVAMVTMVAVVEVIVVEMSHVAMASVFGGFCSCRNHHLVTPEQTPYSCLRH